MDVLADLESEIDLEPGLCSLCPVEAAAEEEEAAAAAAAASDKAGEAAAAAEADVEAEARAEAEVERWEWVVGGGEAGGRALFAEAAAQVSS